MHRRTTTAAATALLLAAAVPAVAAPPVPQSPADGAVSPTLRPVFAWTPGTSGVAIDRYEVYAEVGGAPLRVADAPAHRRPRPRDGGPPRRRDLPLVRAARERERRHRQHAARAAALHGGGDRARRAGAHRDAGPGAGRAVVRVGGRPGRLPVGGPRRRRAAVCAPARRRPRRAAPRSDDLGDGAYVFRVAQVNAAGQEGPAAARAFVVNATAPGAPVPALAGRSAFAWTGMEPGATATWRVATGDGHVVAGPSDTAGTGPRRGRSGPAPTSSRSARRTPPATRAPGPGCPSAPGAPRPRRPPGARPAGASAPAGCAPRRAPWSRPAVR